MGGLLVVALKVRGNVQQILIWIGAQLRSSPWSGARSSPGRATSAASSAGSPSRAALVYAPRERRTLWQVGGVSAVVLISLLAIAARTLVLT